LRYSIKTTQQNNYLFELYFAGTSATGSAGGGGAYGLYRNSQLVLKKKIKSPNYCTLFQIELWIMNKAFEEILQFRGLESVTIFVKSRTVFQSVLNTNSTNPIINKIHNNYYKAIEKGIVIEMNNEIESISNNKYETVRQLSKEAAHSHNRIELDLVPETVIKRTIFDKNIQIWNDSWNASTKGRTTHSFIPTIKERNKIKNYFSPNYYTTQAMTGHGKLNQYLNRFGLRDCVL
jgi:hypothetical protein